MKRLMITLLGTAIVIAAVSHRRGLRRWNVWDDDWDD
jgi:hypothetical protein